MSHTNKKIAPAVVVVILILFILLQTVAIIYVAVSEGLGFFWTLLILLVPLAVAGALIAVYRERMREIDAGENDDLSKY